MSNRDGTISRTVEAIRRHSSLIDAVDRRLLLVQSDSLVSACGYWAVLESWDSG